MRMYLKDEAEVHAWLHENLKILDSKSQAILSLYSIAFAAVTIFYTTIGPETSPLILVATLAQLVLIAWAIIPLARISYVYWSTTEEFLRQDLLLLTLLQLRDRRTKIVRISLWKGIFVLVIFTIMVTTDVVTRIT